MDDGRGSAGDADGKIQTPLVRFVIVVDLLYNKQRWSLSLIRYATASVVNINWVTHRNCTRRAAQLF